MLKWSPEMYLRWSEEEQLSYLSQQSKLLTHSGLLVRAQAVNRVTMCHPKQHSLHSSSQVNSPNPQTLQDTLFAYKKDSIFSIFQTNSPVTWQGFPRTPPCPPIPRILRRFHQPTCDVKHLAPSLRSQCPLGHPGS